MLKGTVAAPGQLTEEQIARVEGKFSELLGQEVSLSLRVDPSLIGCPRPRPARGDRRASL